MANPLRITHLDFSREWRGGQQQLLLLASGLRELGCEQTMVARPGVVGDRLRAAGFAVRAPGVAAAGAVRAAAVAHAHDGHAQSWMLAATLGGGGARVLSRRVAYPIPGWASAWKYRRMHLVIAVSGAVRAEVVRTGLAPERVVVIPDGLELDELPEAAATRERVRREAGLEDSRRWLVCLGAFTPEKGVEDLLQALALLPDDYGLVLTGQGPGWAGLEAQARRWGSRVRFVGGQERSPAEWVAAGDALVMPSRSEGLGSAALLAMGLGRPVAATAVGGIPEVVEHEVTGLLAAAGDRAGLAAACRRLLEETGLGERLSTAAAARVRQRHDRRGLAAATLAAYPRRPRGEARG